LNDLKAKIATDASANSTTSLKLDIQSITQSYRIFMLVMPQISIEAAADRGQNLAGLLSALAGKLQTRLTAAQSAGVHASSSLPLLADMNTKIADAQVKEQAAVNEVASLQPDNGNQTVMQSNLAALKDARSKIQAAQQDFVSARQDAAHII